MDPLALGIRVCNSKSTNNRKEDKEEELKKNKKEKGEITPFSLLITKTLIKAMWRDVWMG